MGQGPKRRSLLDTFADCGLWLSALAGAICVVSVIAMTALGVRPVVVHSGSMDPQYREGSVALVRKVAATQIVTGDVVLGQHAGATELHRVASISFLAGQPVALLKADTSSTVAPDPLSLTGNVYRAASGSLPLGGLAGHATSPATGIAAAMLILLPLLLRTARTGAYREVEALDALELASI